MESESGGPTIRVIFVAEFDPKVLVCLPLGAWHGRKAANRALPPGKLEVASCLVDERNIPVEGNPLSVWMGYFTIYDRGDWDRLRSRPYPFRFGTQGVGSALHSFRRPKQKFLRQNLGQQILVLEWWLWSKH